MSYLWISFIAYRIILPPTIGMKMRCLTPLIDAVRPIRCSSMLFWMSLVSWRIHSVAWCYSLPGWISPVEAIHMSLEVSSNICCLDLFGCFQATLDCWTFRPVKDPFVYGNLTRFYYLHPPCTIWLCCRWAMLLQQRPTQVIWLFESMRMRIELDLKDVWYPDVILIYFGSP